MDTTEANLDQRHEELIESHSSSRINTTTTVSVLIVSFLLVFGLGLKLYNTIDNLEVALNERDTALARIATLEEQRQDIITQLDETTNPNRVVELQDKLAELGTITEQLTKEPGVIVPGIDGDDGTDGEDGRNGVDGEDGRDGRNGTDGEDGVDGRDGTGTDGEDGRDGTDGKDGADGGDGQDGVDGSPPRSWTFTYVDPLGQSHEYTCTDPDADGNYTCTQ